MTLNRLKHVFQRKEISYILCFKRFHIYRLNHRINIYDKSFFITHKSQKKSSNNNFDLISTYLNDAFIFNNLKTNTSRLV